MKLEKSFKLCHKHVLQQQQYEQSMLGYFSLHQNAPYKAPFFAVTNKSAVSIRLSIVNEQNGFFSQYHVRFQQTARFQALLSRFYEVIQEFTSTLNFVKNVATQILGQVPNYTIHFTTSGEIFSRLALLLTLNDTCIP